MIIHHTTLISLVTNAAERMHHARKPNDQLLALLGELEKITEHAEAEDANIKQLLDRSAKLIKRL